MKTEDVQKIVSKMHGCFISENVSDSNFEAANLVDVGHSVAQGLFRIAKAIDGLAEAVRNSEKVTNHIED
jgi:hypothetical protein